MKVLKFGGSSVASAENIIKIKNIVSSYDDNTILVFSAFGGITDQLLHAGLLASQQDIRYQEIIKKIETRHISTVKELIPVTAQSKVLSKVKSELNVLETLLEGAYLIGELTKKLSDKIVSYGELLSSYIIAEYFVLERLSCEHKDSRDLLKTDTNFGNASILNFDDHFKDTPAVFHKYYAKQVGVVMNTYFYLVQLGESHFERRLVRYHIEK